MDSYIYIGSLLDLSREVIGVSESQLLRSKCIAVIKP